MTMTETRPVAAGTPSPPAPEAAPGGWLTSVDHKVMGLVFVYGGLAAVAAGLVAATLFQLSAFGDGIDIWTGNRSRLASAAATAVFVVGLPALWIGLMTHVVPLQIGASRLALPRLQLTSLWTFAAGGGTLAVAYATGWPEGLGLGAAAPPVAATGPGAKAVTELVVVGLGLVGLATFLAAVGILVTILAQRADGMTFGRLPAFSWTALATTTVLVVASPVLLAGLAILYADQHYGGTFFAGSLGGRKVWQHLLWMFGRPEALLLAVPALGVISEILATSLRRPLIGFPLARAGAVAAALMTLLAWAAGASVLRSPFAPTATVPTAAIALPVALVVLCWLASLRGGRGRAQPGLLFALGYVALVALAAGAALVGAVAGVDSVDAEAFRTAHVTMLVLGAPLLGVAAGLHHWAPKLWGRALPAGVRLLQFLLLFGGILAAALPGYVVGLGGDDAVAPLGVAGTAAVGLGALLFATAAGGGRRPAIPAAPGDGLTLEWATTSPPPPHNFDALPEIRSAHPLLGAAGGPGAH